MARERGIGGGGRLAAAAARRPRPALSSADGSEDADDEAGDCEHESADELDLSRLSDDDDADYDIESVPFDVENIILDLKTRGAPLIGVSAALSLALYAEKENRPEKIREKAIDYSFGIANVEEIDKINILNASILAMHRAINTLTIKAELLLIDGNHFKKHSIPHQCIIKGDSKLMSIAAASILAKNYRDELMKKLNIEHPEYNWLNNKGYPTNEHRKNIQNFGITKHHRKSFQLLKN